MRSVKRSRVNRATPRRRGATLVEGAIVLSGLFVVLFGMLDLGLAVLEFNTLSEASRRLCRQAVVHGQMASPQMTAWGPTAVSGTAADSSQYAQALNPELATFQLSNVKYSITWPDGTNQYDDRVQVTVTYQYQPMMPFVFGRTAIPLQAMTTMQVGH